MKKLLFSIAFILICSLAAMASSPSGQSKKSISPLRFKAEQAHEVSDQNFFSNLNFETEKERLLREGVMVSHSFTTPYIEEERIISPKAPMREGEEKPQYFTLTVNLNYDKENVNKISRGAAYCNYALGYSYPMDWTPERKPDFVTFTVASGSYDIEIILETYDFDYIVLTASDINVEDNEEISLDAADATVEITWQPLLPDGTVAYTQAYVFDPETDEWLETLSGNVITSYNYVEIYNNKHNFGCLRTGSPIKMITGDTEYISGGVNIKSMPSEEYEFYFTNNDISENGGYIIPLYAAASQSMTVTNDVTDYQILKPEFAQTPYEAEPQNYGDEMYGFDRDKGYCLNYTIIKNNKIGISQKWSFVALPTSEIVFKNWIYICQTPDLINKYQIAPIPTFLEDWNMTYSVSALPIDITQGDAEVLALNNVSGYDYLRLPDEKNIYLSETVNPWFSFKDSKPHIWNYGCPTFVFSTKEFSWGSSFSFEYVGGLGENRGVDLLSTEAKVSVDDSAPSDNVLENLQRGNLPDEGKIDFVFTDTNVAIDGIAGKNVTHVCFDMSRSDWQPPTLQIVRFIDTQGNFTDRYGIGDEGILEFYGGDFTYNYNSETNVSWYTEEAAAEVKVEYAPYGTDSFLPLEVENVPEQDFMPGFGTYYRGSLAGVDRKSENGWFDVRITLTDAAGNSQEQTLSPAFKIDESVGVESVASPEVAVSVVNGQITVCGCENPIVEVYSTDGILLRRVASSNVDASNLTHGIYLINISDGDKQVVRKVRI